MRVAVLINTPPGNEFWQDVRQAWHDALTTAAPQTQVNFYDTVHEAKFPDPRDYNLIVLSGGKADASSSEPWVLGVLDYVRNTVQDFPKTKILGICWGHQAVSRALGGEVQAVPAGPIAAIQDIKMTEAGKKFFRFPPGTESYRVPQFHVREVGKPAPGSIHLAQNHECFVNEANTVLSFQGHPEIHSALAQKMLLEEDDVYTGNSSKQQIQEELLKLEKPTDGTVILKRIMEWVGE